MQITHMTLYVAYSQLIVKDASSTIAGLEWNDGLVRQGFARQAQHAALGCLLDAGAAYAHLVDAWDARELLRYSRVVELPLLVTSGAIWIESLDGLADMPQAVVAIPNGWYRLLFAQLLNEDSDILECMIGLSPLGADERRCYVRVHEDREMLSRSLITEAPIIPSRPLRNRPDPGA